MCSSKNSDVNSVAEEDEINVDKEYDDDMITDSSSNEQHQSHVVLYCFAFFCFIKIKCYLNDRKLAVNFTGQRDKLISK